MLATAALWRCGYDFRRFLSIEEWFSQDREAYYAALQLGCPTDFYEGRHDPDHSPWLAFFAGVVRQAAAALAQQVRRLQACQRPTTPHPWEALDRRSQQSDKLMPSCSNPVTWRGGLPLAQPWASWVLSQMRSQVITVGAAMPVR